MPNLVKLLDFGDHVTTATTSTTDNKSVPSANEKQRKAYCNGDKFHKNMELRN